VLPGLFETTSLLLALIGKFVPGGKIPGRPFVISPANIELQAALGVVMLGVGAGISKGLLLFRVGLCLLPRDSICYWVWRAEKNHVGRSLMGQLAAGDNTRLLALLAAGFICGGLWEAWNLGARTKWIYSVPFFDELKIGEMPVLGFAVFRPSLWNVMRWSTR